MNSFQFVWVWVVLFLLNPFSPSSLAAKRVPPAPQDACEIIAEKSSKKPLFKFTPRTHEYQGLTTEGLAALRAARDALRSRSRLFENEFRSLSTLHHAGTVARLFKGHMYIYGPKGSAKSAFVNWMMSGESESPFKIQLHQMVTEQAFIGGQDLRDAKKGEFVINTKGSLADFTVALVDETDKGNPASLAVLMGPLNEGEIMTGNRVIPVKLETLYSTSNASLPEMFQQFLENGQGTTAAALFNRFHFKSFVYNWLPIQDQAALDMRRERRRYLSTVAEMNPDALKDEVFLKPDVVNWSEVRQLAKILFKTSPQFMTVYREFVNEMRELTNRAIRDSEEKHQQNHLDEPFVYVPSADYSERLRQLVPEIVVMSAFSDFLLSPLADDANLRALTSKRVELDVLSLWRAFLVMTTVGLGEAKLKFDPDAEQKIDVDFGWIVDPSHARDKREELLIQNLKTEQERFKRTFLKHVANIKEHIELRARNALNPDQVPSFEEQSFELMLSRQR